MPPVRGQRARGGGFRDDPKAHEVNVTTRPNFLFFITDEHRADYLGCYGHPVLKTPHIDSIAARGIRHE